MSILKYKGMKYSSKLCSEEPIGQSTYEWTKKNLLKTAIKKFEIF